MVGVRVGNKIINLPELLNEIETVLLEFQFIIEDPDDGKLELNGVQLVEYLSSTNLLYSGVKQIQNMCTAIEERLINKYVKGESDA